MANKDQHDKDHVEVSLRNYLQRTERDIGNIHQALKDFLDYLDQCGLEIVRKEER